MQPKMAENHMEEDEVYALLDRCREGVLSTVGNDGYPYGTPVNYVRIGDSIYFHGRTEGEKVDNLSSCPRVCFTVMETGGFERTGPDSCNTSTVYESAIVRGTAEKVEDAAEKVRILKAMVERIVPGRAADGMNEKAAERTAVYAIRIESATGKYHRPLPGNSVMR